MTPKRKDEAQVVRTLILQNGKKQKGVVSIRLRPAVLVCELENGKTVEFEERKVQQIDPPLTESLPEEG